MSGQGGRRARSADAAEVVRKTRHRRAPPVTSAAAQGEGRCRRPLGCLLRPCCLGQPPVARTDAFPAAESFVPSASRAACILRLLCLKQAVVTDEVDYLAEAKPAEPAPDKTIPQEKAISLFEEKSKPPQLPLSLLQVVPQEERTRPPSLPLSLLQSDPPSSARTASTEVSSLLLSARATAKAKSSPRPSLRAAQKEVSSADARIRQLPLDNSSGQARRQRRHVLQNEAGAKQEEIWRRKQWDATIQLRHAMEGYSARRIEDACRCAEAVEVDPSLIDDARQEVRRLHWAANIQLCQALQGHTGDAVNYFCNFAEEAPERADCSSLASASLSLCRAIEGCSDACLREAYRAAEASGVACSDIDDVLQEARRVRWEAIAKLRRALEGYSADRIEEACRHAEVAGIACNEVEEARQEARSLRLKANGCACGNMESCSGAANMETRVQAATDPSGLSGVELARTQAHVELRRAMEGYSAARIQDACRRAEAAGVLRSEIDDALQEARRLRWEACAQLRRSLEGYDADRIEDACRLAELAGVDCSEIAEARQEARSLRLEEHVSPHQSTDRCRAAPQQEVRKRAETDPWDLPRGELEKVTLRKGRRKSVGFVSISEHQAETTDQNDDEAGVQLSGYTGMIVAAHRKMQAKRKMTM